MDGLDKQIAAQTGGGLHIGTARDHILALRKTSNSLMGWLSTLALARGFVFIQQPHGKVKAEVNHGRWIVRCLWCAGAEEADPQEPVFYCLSCGNVDNGGRVMEVTFPGERETIEAILLRRPLMENRNWIGEKPGDLLKENFAHGVK